MNLVKILLASTFALTAATTFAASAKTQDAQEEKVVVSTQELPADTSANPESAASPSTTEAPTTEAAAEGAPAPQTNQ